MSAMNQRPRRTPELRPVDLERLTRRGRRIGVVKGRTVFREGQAATESLLLLEGRLELSIGDGETTCRVGDVWPGELAGERALLMDDGYHYVTVTAAANSRGVLLDRGALMELHGTHTVCLLQQKMIFAMQRRLRGNDLTVRRAWQEEHAARARAARQKTVLGAAQEQEIGALRAVIARLLGGAK